MAPHSKRPPLFVADDKFPDVIAQLQSRGWSRFPHESFPKFDLKWSNYAKIHWPRVGRDQIVNHFHNAVVMSRKDALAQRLYASTTGGDVDAFYPRTLDLQAPAAREKLAAWFLYGKAVGLLLQAMETTTTTPSSGTSTAISYLKKVLAVGGFFKLWSQELCLSSLDVWSDCWKPLRDGQFDGETCDVTEIEAILIRLRALDAQFYSIQAGHGDVWICKPANLSQGRGIHLLSVWDALMRIGAEAEAQDDGLQEEKRVAWIVQKYVERPLLLQRGNHKFDVRQWVLITSLEPLTIYWHTDSYLRFCSQPFSLDDVTLSDSFTHLSNYSIQKNAPSTLEDDQAEKPATVDSMWHSRQFEEYLRETHGQDVWNETIVPQMQHATRRAIEAALPEMSQVGRGFEWLGIDFLIDSSFRVWLLEVNVSPDVSHSTSVTAALVPDATRGVLDLILGSTSPDTDTPNGWVKLPTVAS